MDDNDIKLISDYKKENLDQLKIILKTSYFPKIKEKFKANLSDIQKFPGALSKEAIESIRSMLLKHLDLLKGESRLTQFLFIGILENFDSRKKFLEFIGKNLYGDSLGRILTVHNSLLRFEFEKLKLDWVNWHNFAEEFRAECVDYEKVDLSAKWEALYGALDELADFSEKLVLENHLRKDIIAILKEKKQILKGAHLIPENNWEGFIFPNYYKGVAYFKRKGKPIYNSGELAHFGKIKYLLEGFYKKPIKKTFTIQLWQRYPIRDLFQGNFSNCCIAIGEPGNYPAVRLPGVVAKKRPAGVLEYLVDFGVQAAEIFDETETLGQCWLFAALVDKEPVLMVDSIELDVNSPVQRESIKQLAQDFLKRYAAEVGFKKVYLGCTGPIVRNKKNKISPHNIHNDIDTADLEVISCKSIEKIGGYCFNHPYFLEACGGTEAYLFAENSWMDN